MRIITMLAAAALVTTLAGCLQTDTQRGLAGAAAGALVADATDNSALTGAVLGGAAGVFCDDAGICR